MRTARAALLATLIALAPTCASVRPAAAHEVGAGPHGGPMVESKGSHLELVVKGTDLLVHLSDADHNALASKGASGRAVILAGKSQVTVQLQPREPDQLIGALAAPLPPNSRVVIAAKLADGRDLLARFVLK